MLNLYWMNAMGIVKFDLRDWIHCSSQQTSVIEWIFNDRGSLELLARAGCGKTYTLMQAVQAINKAQRGDVALMAFNKKIADELKFKIEQLGYDWRQAQAGTCHSFGLGAWKKMAPNVKINSSKMDEIISQESYRPNNEIYLTCGTVISKLCSLAKQQAVGHLFSIDDDRKWNDIFDHYGLDNDIGENDSVYQIIQAAKRVYQISLNQCRDVIDFDDMILAPLVFKARFWPKDWVLLDESQDTNPARRALALAMLKPRTGRMIFVGDPAQAIYGFAGADSDAMHQLKNATSAKTLPLNETRRCPKAVVREAQKLVPDFRAWEGAEEGIVRSILPEQLFNEKLCAHDAILCRNMAPLVTLAYGFISKGIACQVEGREIGTGLIRLAERWKIKTLDALLTKLDDYLARQTAKFMSKGQEERIEGITDQVECLKVVINSCLLKKKKTVDDLVADIKSMFGDTPEGQRPKVLTLSTIHKSKGREWERVFIYGRRKYLPSPYAKKPWQLQQESNLEYVAITRALKELIDISVAS